MPYKIFTNGKYDYNFLPYDETNIVQFRVRTRDSAFLCLATAPNEESIKYQILLSGLRTYDKEAMYKDKPQDLPKPVILEVPGFLEEEEYRGFWITWVNRRICVGFEGGNSPIFSYKSEEPIEIDYVGVCSWPEKASWIIEEARPAVYSEEGAELVTNLKWQSCKGGAVPSNAFVAGKDEGGSHYVVRVNHKGTLLPGGLNSEAESVQIASDGKVFNFVSYEVLCDLPAGKWMPCYGDKIPPNALCAGETEDGECLYLGRVIKNGTYSLGKVQKSHGLLYIAYSDAEVTYYDYEILVQ